jgi:hypothetical protein
MGELEKNTREEDKKKNFSSLLSNFFRFEIKKNKDNFFIVNTPFKIVLKLFLLVSLNNLAIFLFQLIFQF